MLFPTYFALLFTTVLGTPLATRQSDSMFCSPNFEGVGVSVTNSMREWRSALPITAGSDVFAPEFGYGGVPTLANVDYRLEHTGQHSHPPQYTIKPVQDNNLVVGVRPNGLLELAQPKHNDAYQSWNVVCDFCRSGASGFSGQFSYGCNITSVATGQCVEIDKNEAKPMFLAACNGKDSQNFDIWTKWES